MELSGKEGCWGRMLLEEDLNSSLGGGVNEGGERVRVDEREMEREIGERCMMKKIKMISKEQHT